MRKYSLLMAVIAPLLMVALTACGSSGSGDDVASGGGKATQSGSPAPRSGDDSGLKFAQCMRANGVNVPDPEPGKQPMVVDGPADSKEHKALEACKQFLPDGGAPTKISPEDLEKIRQYAQCMRANGVNMPDPDPEGGLTGETGNETKLAEADKICQSKLPGRQG